MRLINSFCLGIFLCGLTVNPTIANEREASHSIRTVAVFCGADDKVGEDYKILAHDLGEKIAQKGYGLVTGGSIRA